MGASAQRHTVQLLKTEDKGEKKNLPIKKTLGPEIFHRQIPLNIHRANNIHSIQTFPENRTGQNTFQLIL